MNDTRNFTATLYRRRNKSQFFVVTLFYLFLHFDDDCLFFLVDGSSLRQFNISGADVSLSGELDAFLVAFDHNRLAKLNELERQDGVSVKECAITRPEQQLRQNRF